MLNTSTLNEFYNKPAMAPHEHISGFLDDTTFNDLRDNFPSNDLFDDEFPEQRKLNQRPHCRRMMVISDVKQPSYFDKYNRPLSALEGTWRTFAEEILRGKQYSDWIKDTLKIKKFSMRLDFHRTQYGLDVSPHVDSAGKHGSHLFYFMPEGWREEYGGTTCFYKNKLVEKMNPEADDFESFTTYPVTGNYSLLFKNDPVGWHSVTQINCPEDMHRQVFNVVINVV